MPNLLKLAHVAQNIFPVNFPSALNSASLARYKFRHVTRKLPRFSCHISITPRMVQIEITPYQESGSCPEILYFLIKMAFRFFSPRWRWKRHSADVNRFQANCWESVLTSSQNYEAGYYLHDSFFCLSYFSITNPDFAVNTNLFLFRNFPYHFLK